MHPVLIFNLMKFLQTNSVNNSTSGGSNALSILAEVSLGTWIGFLVTLIASFGVLVARTWSRRKRLRRALTEEINNQNISRIVESVDSDLDTELADNDNDNGYQVDASQLPPASSIPTQLYESSAVNIGILPSVEISRLVSYYSLLTTQKGIIQSIRSSEEVAYADKRELCENISDLEQMRSDVLSDLQDSTVCERIWDRMSDICQANSPESNS